MGKTNKKELKVENVPIFIGNLSAFFISKKT